MCCFLGSTPQPHYNTVAYSMNLVTNKVDNWLPLPIFLVYKTLIIKLFCYNTDFTMGPKISVITWFQCTLKFHCVTFAGRNCWWMSRSIVENCGSNLPLGTKRDSRWGRYQSWSSGWTTCSSWTRSDSNIDLCFERWNSSVDFRPHPDICNTFLRTSSLPWCWISARTQDTRARRWKWLESLEWERSRRPGIYKHIRTVCQHIHGLEKNI